MPRRSTNRTRAAGALPYISVDASRREPLYEQLYSAIREHILRGRLRPGSQLASSRALAAELDISRFTVVTALARLAAEGYIVATVRGGTFVARSLPDLAIRAQTNVDSGVARSGSAGVTGVRGLSKRGRAVTSVMITGPREEIGEPRAFRPRRPPLDAFPFALWARIARRQWRTFRHRMLDYGEPAGLRGLREALADHVAATRGVRCTPEQIVVTSGAQQAYNLLFQLLLDPGDGAWIEEPGYLDVRGALVAAGARIVPVPVDASGLVVDAGIAAAPRARLAYVSPSHQYPTGATLSASRRIQLLQWAHRTGAWIVEDDYDSYFRYTGRPLPALQRLDTDGLAAIEPRTHRNRGTADPRVVYVGTFSKTVFPSLRLGYCIVPEALVAALANARAIADRNSSLTDQAALEIFIREGHYDRHLRRVRATCVERYEAILYSMDKQLGGAVAVPAMNAGTHVLGYLSRGIASAKRISQAASEDDMVVFPLSRYCLKAPKQDALVLGYGGLSPALIESGVKRLARVIESATRAERKR